jgi:hypothetical protein
MNSGFPHVLKGEPGCDALNRSCHASPQNPMNSALLSVRQSAIRSSAPLLDLAHHTNQPQRTPVHAGGCSVTARNRLQGSRRAEGKESESCIPGGAEGQPLDG